VIDLAPLAQILGATEGLNPEPLTVSLFDRIEHILDVHHGAAPRRSLSMY
jgi:hypothetical protein